MDNLYENLCEILGNPPNEIIGYFYYVICAFLIIMSVKLLFTFIFKFLLNTRF